MDRTEFHYDLPAGLIAQQPLSERTASRLLVVDGDLTEDRRFSDLPGLLRAGDLLVLNDTRVIRARLRGRKPTGGQVEMLLERITGTRTATAQIKASRSPRAGSELRLANGASARVLGRRGSLFRLEFNADIEPLLETHGEVPLPPYIRRSAASPKTGLATRLSTPAMTVPSQRRQPDLHFDSESASGASRRMASRPHF